jgi:hypothetical protein
MIDKPTPIATHFAESTSLNWKIQGAAIRATPTT